MRKMKIALQEILAVRSFAAYLENYARSRYRKVTTCPRVQGLEGAK